MTDILLQLQSQIPSVHFQYSGLEIHYWPREKRAVCVLNLHHLNLVASIYFFKTQNGLRLCTLLTKPAIVCPSALSIQFWT